LGCVDYVCRRSDPYSTPTLVLRTELGLAWPELAAGSSAEVTLSDLAEPLRSGSMSSEDCR